MSIDSPLFLTRLECPLCGTINEFETIRVGAYQEGDRMTDFCPSVIKWRNSKYQKYHPTLFFTATCSNCYYTREFNNKYKGWQKDNNFRTYRRNVLKEKHMLILASNESIIKEVATHLDQENYPNETAILKLIMAIYDEQLAGHESHLDLGRFYLRIAWMFRFMNTLDKFSNTQTTKQRVDNVNDIERSLTELNNWWSGFKRNLEYVKSAVKDHFNHPEFTDIPAGDDVTIKLQRLAEFNREGTQIIDELCHSLLSDAIPMTSGEITGGQQFFEFNSFVAFLERLHQIWEGVPRDEQEALRLTIKHYMEAFESGREIAHGNQSIQAVYLIAELSRQIGDHDTARKYFNNTIRMGQDFINEIKGDRTRTALARKILELAMTQGKKNLAEAKT